ncbi:MAG TPA: TIGR03960 family B12-binding radical SAM protein, partial [Verrucomicrobiae bacterium]|nr:TIGR03960 family B12-binding radical SAM protein [Verrucomicrobiae bacterium]
MRNTLLSIEKPCRYIGGETGSAPPADGTRFVLAFPDTYEVGMSHLGSQILYAVLKAAHGVTPERVYAPWPDREEQLRGHGEILATLESSTPLCDADIVGFTLQYELSYSNIVNMLRMGGIPPLAAERDSSHPLVVGGGPCACNPEPLADFFDAFLLGDGEEAVVEIAAAYADWKQAGEPKETLLARLAALEGVYVPSFFRVEHALDGTVSAITPLHSGYSRVRRRVLKEIDSSTAPLEPVVPLMKTVHDRVSVEIARGCTRGCRFCQAGYIYRPVRERTPERVMQIVEETLRGTGYEEVSLLSLSTGDYGCVLPLLKGLMARLAPQRVAVSFPSLRVGTLSTDIAEEVRKVRKTGFTLAPEAGSERLRQAINKGITEEDLLANAAEVFRAGWRVIKLYFMMGLPGETREDLLAIAELSAKVKTEARRAGGGEVNVSVSTFVPKPHTPFQWEPQISLEEIRRNQGLLRDELRRRKLNFKWHDAPVSFL